VSSVVFVTGTDTGVGKTLVTSAIAACLRAEGRRVGVYKPVETGCEELGGRRIGRDCQRLRAAAGGRQDVATVATYLLTQPAAPMVAAAAEDVTVDPARIERDLAAVRAAHDVTLVEGAGGLLVPITDGVTYLDLARRLGLPVLVVVGSRLGCINHALLTLGALASADLRCVGYVLNCIDPSNDGPASPARNRAAIAAFTTARELGLFPYVAQDARDDFRRLAELARKALRLDTIFRDAA
jgi:dethiobiotin synthetase